MSAQFADIESVMRRAVDLAYRGVGHVEPNPPVGAVITDDRLRVVGEGWHERFGGPHAEVNAIARAGGNATGCTLFVTLEPCCRSGKTGPCTGAIVRAGLRRVVIGVLDPSMDKDGVAALRAAGIEVEVGVLERDGRRLAAPFLKRVTTGLPYVHAKWAMTLDGKIATSGGDSRWISSEESRAIVHRLRGRMDAILVGSATAERDDPLLTARPAGPRIATRVVLDGSARLSPASRLAQTAREVPVLVAALDSAPDANVRGLEGLGVNVLRIAPQRPAAGLEPCAMPDLRLLLEELGRRGMTNVLIEGGGRLLGSAFDARLIDAAHVFIAPILVGGAEAVSPIGGAGLADVAKAARIADCTIEMIGGDVYMHGIVDWKADATPGGQALRSP
jgi:diaminohydroxyphosphoribosylaminopyrimidine deaminase/5-amino-6-(5-phosphoribosylamino)uracil reductase